MLRGTGDELLVGKFGVKLANFRPDLVNFALEPFRLGGDVDNAGKRERERRLVEYDLYGAGRRLAEAHGLDAGKAEDRLLVALGAGRGRLSRAGDDERHFRAGR